MSLFSFKIHDWQRFVSLLCFQKEFFFDFLFVLNINKVNNKKMECIQIIDGLLLGPWNYLQDQFFLSKNQIGLVIHSPAMIIPTNFCRLRYIEFKWFVQEEFFSAVLLKRRVNTLLQQISCLEQNYENTFICDDGVASSPTGLCCLILMTKFKWNLLKTLQYLSKKVRFFNLQPEETQCLLQYDRCTNKNPIREKLCTWEKEAEISEEAVLARNTYLNSDMKRSMSLKSQQGALEVSQRVRKRVSFKESHLQVYIEKDQSSALPTRFAAPTKDTYLKQFYDTEPQKAKQNIDIPFLHRRLANENDLRISLSATRPKSQRINSNSRIQKQMSNFNRKKTQTNREPHSKSEIQSYELLQKIRQKISTKFKARYPQRQLKLKNNMQAIKNIS